jgi:hypothetical protein
VTLDISVAGGKVDPSGKSVPVKAGQTVRITASSGVEDTIHLHGYDKELAMKPGSTTERSLPPTRAASRSRRTSPANSSPN